MMQPDTGVSAPTPLTPEIISQQATINIGTIGNVAHGKSTLVKAITGIQTGRFSSEKARNMTIKLGYANAKIYKCDNERCLGPARYRSCSSSKEDTFPCQTDKVVRAGSNCSAMNEPCPMPQTKEHLAVMEIMNLKHILILQNKIDLVIESQAREHTEQIQDFVRGTIAESSPVIQISAHYRYNIDVVCEYIAKIPIPVRDFTSEPRLTVIRSFDVNKPGCEVDDLKGGVVGGSILKGVLRVDMEIEVRPGMVSKDQEGKLTCKPIKSRIVSLCAEQNDLQYAVPGGLIGVGTKIDPTLCRADRMVGQVLGAVNSLPDIYTELTISFFLLRRLLGVKTEGDKRGAKVLKLSVTEILMVHIGSLCTGVRVLAVKCHLAKIGLVKPVCAEIGEKIALSRHVEKHWRLIGWGQIQQGVKVKPVDDT